MAMLNSKKMKKNLRFMKKSLVGLTPGYLRLEVWHRRGMGKPQWSMLRKESRKHQEREKASV
jgi:hypothetical protein